MRRLSPLLLGLIVATTVLHTAVTHAGEPYRKPPADIVKMLTAPPLPSVSVDPTRRHMLLIEHRPMPMLSDLAQPMLRLAGRRINPNTNGPHRTSGITGIRVRPLDGGPEVAVPLPAGRGIGTPRWSPNGERFAFTVTDDGGVTLAVYDVATGVLTRIDGHLNATGRTVSWMPDSVRLLVRFVPAGRGATPERPAVPDGPIVQEAANRTSPVRTYQDLLTDPHDEALFDHYFTEQLALVQIIPGGGWKRRDVGAPAIYAAVDPSPTARYLLTSRVVRPYSYQVTMGSFPKLVEVRDLRTDEVTLIADQPLADRTPIGGVPTGPRRIRWQNVVDSQRLLWAEALDEGNPKNEVPHRDRIMNLDAPFDGEPRELHRTEHRVQGMTWIEHSSLCLVGEYDRDRRWTRTWLLSPGAPDPARLVWDRSIRDRYGDPGRPMMTTNRDGRRVAMLRGGWIWLTGSGASPEGDRPFLDRLSLETLETERLWQCSDGAYEQVVDVLERPGGRVLTRHEAPDAPPNYFAIDLDTGERSRLTDFADPQPELRSVRKEIVRYPRDDGVDLSATLYLPPGYDRERDGPLPLIVWAYPREFNDPYTAGQVRGSPHRFTRISGTSHLFLLLAGYAIMDRATMPVIGSDPETVNDTFIDQIVASARAAIDEAERRGVADPTRVGVGGHSYGAFMTANLLAHSDLFRAGIARSGAYNRTLTPFGFQAERRTFWEAPETYFELSPFMHAHEIDEPLLLIHGRRDNNSGTFPIQSERLFHAVKGNGGTVRLVMLPHESHGYRAEESIMHVLAEMIDWFERHVKSGT
ncbi:MAG: S9 family peptidase [Planctomycetes bacterium]|nr:S9 family peptidase [Planctomycetota bacterium]